MKNLRHLGMEAFPPILAAQGQTYSHIFHLILGKNRLEQIAAAMHHLEKFYEEGNLVGMSRGPQTWSERNYLGERWPIEQELERGREEPGRKWYPLPLREPVLADDFLGFRAKAVYRLFS